MKYALLIYAEPTSPEDAEARRGEAASLTWLDYTTAMKEAGVALGAEQLRPVDSATTVSTRDGERLLTDGPFMETKEHLLGFYLIDVPDLDTALTWAEKMPVLRYGKVEIRPVMEGQRWRTPLE